MGRPSDLTPAVQKKIVRMVRDGVSPEVAARAAGIAASTYYLWRAKARENPEGPYLEFSEAIETAVAECEARAVKVIQRAAPQSWQAAMTLIERRFPNRWGRRERIDVYEHERVRREAERIAAELNVPVDQVLREAGVQFPVSTN